MADLAVKLIKADGTEQDFGLVRRTAPVHHPEDDRHIAAKLSAVHICGKTGKRTDLGVLSYRYVTTAFCALVVDTLQAASNNNLICSFAYHGCGTGTTAESKAQTALVTEVTTGGFARATGSLTESSSLVFKTVGTVTFSGSHAITEHGIFNADNDPTPGTMLDRSVFSAISVVATDSIQFTYELTVGSDDPA